MTSTSSGFWLSGKTSVFLITASKSITSELRKPIFEYRIMKRNIALHIMVKSFAITLLTRASV